MAKLKYTRSELTKTESLFTGDIKPMHCTCRICGQWWWQGDPTQHCAECPLGDPDVTGLMMLKLKPQIVFVARPGAAAHQRLWWTGPSGSEYHIEKLPATVDSPHGRVAMFDQPGNERLVAGSIAALKRKIRKNLGEY